MPRPPLLTSSTLLVSPLALIVLAGCAGPEASYSGEGAAAPLAGLEYPEARREALVEDYHGTPVADPYRWLEDPDAPEVRAWIEAQNAVTGAHLSSIPGREAIAERVAELWTYERFGVPERHGAWYYFTYDDGTLSQPLLVRARDLRSAHEVVLDPNAFSTDGTVSLGGTSYSNHGRYLAYGTSDGGSDWRTWRVRDLATGRDLPDVVEWSRFGTPDWAADDSGFYYGRYPETDRKLTARARNQSVWFHRLGTEQSEDVLVHEDPENPERSFSVFPSEDGSWLMLFARDGTARRNRLWFRDATAGAGAPWRKVFDDFDAQYLPLGNEGATFWLRTDLDAPRGRIVSVDVARPDPALTTVVSEREHTLSGADRIGGRLILSYLVDATSQVVVHESDGTRVAEVPLPGIGSTRGFDGKQDRSETFFSFSSYTTPTTIFRYDVATGAKELFRQPRVPFASADYETRRVFYSSKDGTRVPMFLTRRNDLGPGPHPTLLYGYGGFRISMQPRFTAAVAAWLDLGGVYAVACLRGGGEYGREWHQAGTLGNKQNVFDDFIAAGEWLVDEGITSRDRLGLYGASNGGLLVGACLNQRPDLFGAAVPGVGVMDMLRYHEFTVGAAWASDYGRSDDPEMFPHLLAYSPYHNVREGEAYPPTMVTTADHDDRVVPAHSFKYAAALQHAQAGPAPVLIRVDTRAGHGAGKSREQRIAEVADRWAFLAEHLGVPR